MMATLIVGAAVAGLVVVAVRKLAREEMENPFPAAVTAAAVRDTAAKNGSRIKR